MLSAHRCVENVPGLQQGLLFDTLFPVAHPHLPIEHHEDFLAVIDVPFVGLVGPVQARGDAVHVGDIQRRPGAVPGEGFAANDFQGIRPEER
ncbi:hypothetical protein D3C84_986110 [compost metagenome]